MVAATITGICVSLYLIYYFIFPAAAQLISFSLPILLPFILAAVLAILLDPLVDLATLRGKVPRGWAVFLVLTIFIAGISAIIVLLFSRLLLELYVLSQNIPDLSQLFRDTINKAQYYYSRINLPPEVLDQLQQVATKMGETLTGTVTAVANGLLGFMTALPNMLMVLLITLIATFFFCKDRDRLQRAFFKLFSEPLRHQVRSVYLDLSTALLGYFRAMVTLISITMLFAIIGLTIIGAEYALTMGLVIGFFDVLPILGPGTVFLPWVVWCLITGQIKMAVSLGCLYVIIIVVRQIMEPKLVAQNIGVHPLATLSAIFIGLKTLGVWGIILGPAILVIGKAIHKVRNA